MRRFEFNDYGILEWIAKPPVVRAGAAAFDQYHARVRDDSTALNTSGGWLGNLDSNPTLSIATGTGNRFRIRFMLDEYVNKIATVTPQLEYNRNGGGWTNVTASSTHVQATLSSQYADDAPCDTQLLTGSDPTGSFDTSGNADEVNGATAGSTLGTKGSFIECEFCVYFVDAAVADLDTIQFRVNALNIDTWTYAGPTVTVDKTGPYTGYETLAATGTGTPALTTRKDFYRTLPATAVGTAAFIKQASKTLAATGLGTAVLNTAKTLQQIIAATGTGTAAINTNKIVDPGLGVKRWYQTTEQTYSHATTPVWTAVTLNSDGGNLEADIPYLIIAEAQLGQESQSPVGICVTHGGTVWTDSQCWIYGCDASPDTNRTFRWVKIYTPSSSEALGLEYRPWATSIIITADNVNIIAIPLDHVTASSDYYSNEHATDTALNSGWKDFATITFTPGTASHDWLILGAMQYDVTSTTTPHFRSRLNWSGGVTSTEPYMSKEPRSASEQMMIPVQVVRNLAASSHTIKWQGQLSATGVAGDDHLWSTIIAIDLDACFEKHSFECNPGVDDHTAITSTNYGLQVATCSLTPDTAAEDVLALGFWVLDSSSNYSSRGRLQADGSDINTGVTTAAQLLNQQFGSSVDLYPSTFAGIDTAVTGATAYDLDGSSSNNATENLDDTCIVAISLVAPSTVSTSYKTLAATAVGTAVITTVKTAYETLAASGVGTAVLASTTTFARTLAATGVGTGALNTLATWYRTLASTGTGTPALTTIATFPRTLAATGVGTPTLAPAKTLSQLIAAAATGGASLSTISTWYRTINASGIGTASLDPQKTLGQILAAVAVGTASITDAITYLQTLPSTGVGTPGLVKGMYIDIDATGTGTPGLTTDKTLGQILAATAVGTAVVSTVSTWYRTLTALGSGTPAITPSWQTYQTLAATGSGTAGLSTLSTYYRTLASTGTGTPTLEGVQLILRTLNATATGTAAISPLQIAGVTMAATATGTPELTKIIGKLMAVSATGTPVINADTIYPVSLVATAVGTAAMSQNWQTYVTLPANATGTAVLSGVQLILRTMNATASGTAGLSTVKTGYATLAASATGTPALTRTSTWYRTLAASGIGTPDFTKKVSKTLAATATGTAVLVGDWITQVTMAATATAVAAIGTVYTPGTYVPPTDKSRRRSMTRFASSLRFRRH